MQWLLSEAKVLLEGKLPRASLKLRGGEHIFVTGEAEPRPLRAVPEAINLDVQARRIVEGGNNYEVTLMIRAEATGREWIFL